MFKSIIQYILTNIFKINTQTTKNEINENSKYASAYEQIDNINFDAIFSNKLANYVTSDSTLTIKGENKRSELLDKTCQSMWKKSKKIVSMGFGYGGVFGGVFGYGGGSYHHGHRLIYYNNLHN